jgi:hypothetical protein
MNQICLTFEWRSSSKFLFATATVFVRNKYRKLVKCRGLMDSLWHSFIWRERFVKLLHMRRCKAYVLVKSILEVTRTIHFAASLEEKSWFSIWENKIGYAVLLKITGMIPAKLVHSSDWFISESLMVADDNFKSLNSTDILLGDDVFFEVCRHGQKTRPRNYPILWGR